MRILQVCPYAMDRRGGVQSHVRDLSRWLAAAGHDVAVVAPGPSGASADPRVLPLGRHVSVGMSGTRFEVTWVGGRELAEARRRLDAASIDVVHVHTPFVPFLPVRLWRALRRPVVATFHATLPPRDRLLAAVLGPVARAMRDRAAVSIAVSASAAALLGGATAVDALVPPAIDLSAWRAAGDAVDRSARSGPPQVLFLGRFEERKGLRVLVEAWPEVAARTDARLIVAGGGELAALAVDLARRFPERVALVETPDDATARRLVAEADLMVAPSLWGESFGLVLAEALAAGTPPVAAANSGYAEVLTGPGTRLLTPPGDAAALAARLVDLVADGEARARLSAWGRDHVAAYDVAAVGPKLVELYARAAGTAGRGAP